MNTYHRNVPVPSILYHEKGIATRFTNDSRVSENNIVAMIVDDRVVKATLEHLKERGFLFEKQIWPWLIESENFDETGDEALYNRRLTLIAIGHTDTDQTRALIREFKARGTYLDRYNATGLFALEYKIAEIPWWSDRDGCGPTQLSLF